MTDAERVQRAEQIALLVPVSQLRTAIVNLFPDTDIGLTRMRRMDELIADTLAQVEREAWEEAARLAKQETLEGEWDADFDPKIHRFADDVAKRCRRRAAQERP